MSVLVDTNILIYAVHTEAREHRRAKAFMEEQRAGDGFCVTWSILYEFLRIVTHPRVFVKPLEPRIAARFVLAIAEDPRVDILVETPQHHRFLRRVLDHAPPLRGSVYHDAHIAALMLEHGLSKIATADRHFRLFPFLDVVDPTAAGPSGA
jgi:toxin-antitoxin system PIN domain toxin